jgi:hypothetical protein
MDVGVGWLAAYDCESFRSSQPPSPLPPFAYSGGTVHCVGSLFLDPVVLPKSQPANNQSAPQLHPCEPKRPTAAARSIAHHLADGKRI